MANQDFDAMRTMAAPTADVIAFLCSRRVDQLSVSQRLQLERVAPVKDAPSNDPVCRNFLLMDRKNCKEYLDLVQAPLSANAFANCADPNRGPLNDYDTLFAQMWFRDYLVKHQGRIAKH
jgi:hypothetical protein